MLQATGMLQANGMLQATIILHANSMLQATCMLQATGMLQANGMLQLTACYKLTPMDAVTLTAYRFREDLPISSQTNQQQHPAKQFFPATRQKSKFP